MQLLYSRMVTSYNLPLPHCICYDKLVRNKSGFTVIEILVVILVIGIISTISIVVYGNIQKNAQTSKITSATRNFHQGIKLYALRNNTLPVVGLKNGWNYMCLGRTEDYPANATFQSGECINGNSGTVTPHRFVSVEFNTELATTLGTTPSLETPIRSTNDAFRGMWFSIWYDVGRKPSGGYLNVITYGDTCIIGKRWSYDSKNNTSWCVLTLDANGEEKP